MLAQTGTISTGPGTQPRVIAISPDGSTLYIVNQSGNNWASSISATNTVTRPSLSAANPPSCDQSRRDAALCHQCSSAQLRVRHQHRHQHRDVDGGVGGTALSVAVSPNGQFFYVAAQNQNQVRIFNADDQCAGRHGLSASSPTGLVISPDGSTLYVSNNGSDNLQAFSINASTGLLTSLGFFSTGLPPGNARHVRRRQHAGGAARRHLRCEPPAAPSTAPAPARP